MKKILCYGDSNTYGYNPFDGSRYDEKARWTALLQSKLGSEYEIIEEGTCDRTGFVDNPKGVLFSAQKHFSQLVASLDSINLIIIALGTNDLQFQYKIDNETIEQGLENLILTAKTKTERVVLIPPVILNEKVLEGYFNFQFDETSITKSQKAGKIYEKLAQIHNCKIFDINNYTKPSDVDGLHYSEKEHKIIADELSKMLAEL